MFKIKATTPQGAIVYYHKPARLHNVQFIPNPQAGKVFETLEQAYKAWAVFRYKPPYNTWLVEYEKSF